MRQRLVQVLQTPDTDDLSSDVLRRFWTRAKPLPARIERRPDARVIDLATWAQGRHDYARR
jgi:hypothetical protein